MRRILQLILLVTLPFVALKAQINIAPQAVVTGSTCNTGACGTLNDLNLGICGTQQMWVTTLNPPSTTPGVEWIEWNFTGATRNIGRLVIHHGQTGGRYLGGALIQRWNGTTWVNHHTFSGLNPNICISNIPIPVLSTNRFRITSFVMTVGQLSNPNFREI